MMHKTSSVQSVLKSLWSEVAYTSRSDYYTTYKALRDAFKQSSLLLSGQAQQLRETLSKVFNADSPADIDLSLSMKPWTMPNANGDGGSPADDAVASAFKGQKGQSLAKVLAPSATINGLSQAQLGDEWWKTIYSMKDIVLAAGLSAQLDFGNGDLLTFVGVQSSNLSIQSGMITLI
jgi:hypothetical protein